MAQSATKRELARKLRREGQTLPEIQRAVQAPKTTVWSWIRDLPSPRNDQPSVTREQLLELIARGCSQIEIADTLGIGRKLVRNELRKHGLRTRYQEQPQVSEAADRQGPPERTAQCGRHGDTRFVRVSRGSGIRYVCAACRSMYVGRRRRKIKEQLVAEHGGGCLWCGYNGCLRALHFHHVDPTAKAFEIAQNRSIVSIDRLRAEAEGCVLLCSNHHAEAEDGVITRQQLEDRLATTARSSAR